KGGGAAGTVEQSLLADFLRQGGHARGADGESPGGNGGSSGCGGAADHPSGAADGKVHSWLQHAGGNHGHYGDEGLRRHAAIADQPGFSFATNQLGGGAAGNEGMKSADRAAGDGDEG